MSTSQTAAKVLKSVSAENSNYASGRRTPKGVQSQVKRGEVFAGSWLFSEKRALFWLSLVNELYGTDCAVKTAQLLLRRYFKHGGKVYGAQLKMAEILRVHPNTISNHVRRLKNAGLITVTESPAVRDKASGLWCRRETNRYWLRFPCAAQATNRRVARRRSLLGVVALPVDTVLSEEAVALLNSPIAQEIMAEIDGNDSVVPGLTYTQPDGSESFTGTKETGPYVVTVPGVVEKQVVPPKIEPEPLVSAAEAFVLMRAQLKRVGR
jgi:DNA-binding transcriptional ArsR family regulator